MLTIKPVMARVTIILELGSPHTPRASQEMLDYTLYLIGSKATQEYEDQSIKFPEKAESNS
jgi:hypothetical protein